MSATGATADPELVALRDITSSGVRSRVLEAGRPDAPPLVLLHGFLASHRSFEDSIPALAEHFRVVAPDLPGFGDSGKPTPASYGYHLDAFTDTVADLISALGLGRTTLLGHDIGGAVSLNLAVRHPELAQRVILVAPPVYPLARTRRLRLLGLPLVGPVLFKQLLGRGAFRRFFRADVYSAEHGFPLDRVDDFYDRFNAPSAREAAWTVLQSFADTRRTRALVSRVQAPALVLWGQADKLLPAPHATRLARELRARLHLLDAGHAPHEAHPGEFVRVVCDFCGVRR